MAKDVSKLKIVNDNTEYLFKDLLARNNISSLLGSGILTSLTLNTFFAAPSNKDGVPLFRKITASDLPVLNQDTTGIASYAKYLRGRQSDGTYYGSLASNNIIAEWNTKSDNRWYLKAAETYECRVDYATTSDKVKGTLKFGSKSFNGSLDVVLLGSDLGSVDLTSELTITGLKTFSGEIYLDSLNANTGLISGNLRVVNGIFGNLIGNASTATNINWSGVTNKPNYAAGDSVGGSANYLRWEAAASSSYARKIPISWYNDTETTTTRFRATYYDSLTYRTDTNTISSNISGNSATATKLQTARTLTIGNTEKSFDGSSNISWTLSEIGAAPSGHTHNYLPLSGGTLTGSLTVNKQSYFHKRLSLRSGAAIDFYDEDGNLRGVFEPHASLNYSLSFYDTTAWRVLLHSGNFNSYVPKLDGTGASGTWGINIRGTAASAIALAYNSFDTASQITTAYTQWANKSGCSDVPSMSYAAVLNVGYDNYRWWQIWNSRSNHQLFWRPEKIDASGFADVHTLIDDKNISNYLPIVTDYYWANIKVSDSSNNNTSPIFGKIGIGVTKIRGLLDLGSLYTGHDNSGHFIEGTNTENHLRILLGDSEYKNYSSIHLIPNYVGINKSNPSHTLDVAGDIYTTTGFKKKDSSNSYVLLGGGGHKNLNDFSMYHKHPYLPLAGGTMTLGEGLKFHADENYFGTNLDARIISLLDGNDTVCDGGLIIDERATYNGVEHVTELLRIRDSEFKWKGNDIYHKGNLSPMTTSHPANSITQTNINNWNAVHTWYTTATANDTTNTIDTWKEIEAFVSSFNKGDNLATYLANNYLAKSGGTMSGDIKFTNKGIVVIPGNTDLYIWKVYSSTDGLFGFKLQYNGTGSGNNNSLTLIADNQDGEKVKAYSIKQDGTITFATTPKVETNNILHSGNSSVSGNTININGTSTTWTDTKVTQDNTTTGNWRKLVLSALNGASAAAISVLTGQVYVNANIECLPSTGTLKSTNLLATSTISAGTTVTAATSVTSTAGDFYVGGTSGSRCHIKMDTTNKCIKFIFD